MFRLLARLLGLSLYLAVAGCGTTKWSDTPRTATEQLIISTAIDRAINNIDFKPLAGKTVYFDATYLTGVVDMNYVISSMRQRMLAQGCVLKVNKDEADYVVEARAGAVGTNQHNVLIGIPAISVPTAGLMPGVPSAIPEIPFAKTTDQKGVAKIAAFAYNQHTGQAVWQSGTFPVVSNAKDTWFLGTGPFQRGSIYDGTHFAGSRFLFSRRRKRQVAPVDPDVPVTAEAIFQERPVLVKRPTNKVSQAGGSSPPASTASAAKPPAPGAPVPVPANSANSGESSGSMAAQVVLPSLSTGAKSASPAPKPAPAATPSPAPSSAPSSTTSGTSGGLTFDPAGWMRLK
ncbi:MAG TPA: DUF6655 family protein [Pirellulales bacterium]|nr:DUF6655 family protein [Pirellulales bacterium]